MSLRLKLKAGEKFIVNGAVIVNGDRPTALSLGNFAHVLRESDVMLEEAADTPAKRAYYAAQLMLIDQADLPVRAAIFYDLIRDLLGVFKNPEVRDHLERATGFAATGDYYKILAELRPVIKYEALLLLREQTLAPAGVPSAA